MGRKGEIEFREYRAIEFTPPEANDVLMGMESIGVTIGVDVTDAIGIIDNFLQGYQQRYWAIVMIEICAQIRKELLKSRNVVDLDMVRKVVDYLEKPFDEEEEAMPLEEKDKDGSGSEGDKDGSGSEGDKEGDKDGSGSSEGSGSDTDDDEGLVDVGEGSESEDEEDSDDEEWEDDPKFVMPKCFVEWKNQEEEEEVDFKDPTLWKRLMEDLKLECSQIGLSLKQGYEDKILEMMIPYFRRFIMYRDGIKDFMEEVREHIDKSSTLDDLKTLKDALRSSVFDHLYDDCKVKEEAKLKKNMVPTKEEGIATPMNQINQDEKRECGDMMEIEEKETLNPLNLPEQAKESTGNAYSSCIKESLERGGANKRKLAQI